MNAPAAYLLAVATLNRDLGHGPSSLFHFFCAYTLATIGSFREDGASAIEGVLTPAQLARLKEILKEKASDK